MTIREISHLWQEGEIVEEIRGTLMNQCSQVRFPLDQETKQEIEDLLDTFLADEKAVGLAAPQIGVKKCFFVFDPKHPATRKKTKDTSIVVINPVTVPSRNDSNWLKEAREDDLTWDAEGCLSLPDVAAQVPRLKRIKLKGFDMNGKRFSKKFEGYPARIVQHEMDHLLGKMIIHYGPIYPADESQVPVFRRIFSKLFDE